MDGYWGKEEIIDYCPFLPGTPFHINIICTNDGFHVSVNKNSLFNYNQTKINQDIDSIVINGDIIITKVVIH